MELPLYLTIKIDYIYILKTAFPHYLGCVRNFSSTNEYSHFVNRNGLSGYVKDRVADAIHEVHGYNIVITFAGTLEGNRLFVGRDVIANLNREMELMAEWYYLERIAKDEKRYLKFKTR